MLLNREDPLATGVSNGKRFILFLYCLRLASAPLPAPPWKRYKLSVKIRIFACANTARTSLSWFLLYRLGVKWIISPPWRIDVTLQLISDLCSLVLRRITPLPTGYAIRAIVYLREILVPRAFRIMRSSFLSPGADIIFPLRLTRDTRIIQERYTWSAKKYG